MNMASVPLAALDVGSNTIHLVVARLAPEGRDLIYLADEVELVRLGADVSATGDIGAERMDRALATIRHQVDRAHALGAATVLGIATEGVRAARNGSVLRERAQREAGITLELVTGDQEAALTYWGATSGTAVAPLRRAVLDLGGGSLELVVGEGSRVLWRVSLPLGSGATASRYTPSDPPSEGELAAARRDVDAALALLDPPLPVTEVIACGGTATTLVRLSARALRTSVAPEEVTMAPASSIAGAAAGQTGYLTKDELKALVLLLQEQPAAVITARYGIETARARLLGAGSIVLLGALQRLGVDVLRVSPRGIREGALLAYGHAGARWLDVATAGVGW